MAEYTRGYNPNRSAQWNYGGEKWKLSRSKIDLFIECPRCFYIDNKLGTKRPSIPSFNLNIAVDTLFKKEFDRYRKEKKAHPIMEAHRIDAVPFEHKDLEIWRDPFAGITYTDQDTGLLVSGAVDDLWLHRDGSLIVIDYKATSKDGEIKTLADSSWEAQYQRQIGVYQWLFSQNGFSVSKTAYFVYANARTDKDAFDNTLSFETTLVPCEGETSWIPSTLKRIHECLLSDTFPDGGQHCEYCQYREACGKKLQTIHYENKRKNTKE